MNQARVTQVVNDVKLLPEQSAPRPAEVSDAVRGKTAVRTGTQSRSELTFNDQSITRLGANTIFSFDKGTRVMNLGEGAILFQVPKGSGGAIIKTAAVTAAITGTTGIGEFHAGTGTHPKPIVKWFCLEGTIHISLTNGSGQEVVLKAGQMIASDGTKLPQPASFNIAALKRTSLFFTGFKAPLPSLDLITVAENNQIELVASNEAVANAPSVIPDTMNIVDTVDQGMSAGEMSEFVLPTPSATPTATLSPSATPTPTATVSPSATPIPTATVSPSATPTPTATVSPSATPTPTATVSPSATPTPTATVSPSATPTPTATVSPSATPTPTATVSPSATPTPTATVSPSATPTPTATVSPTATPTPTATVSPTATPTPTVTPTPSPGSATATYNSASNGNWSNPAVWTPNVVPNNGNNGDTYDAVISGGTLTQDITDGVTIQQLFMNGGTLVLTNPLTLNDGLHYVGGTIRNGILFVAGASTQSNTMAVNATNITNRGGYDLTFDGNAFSGSATFTNSGLLRKTMGAGSLNFNNVLTNSGTVLADSGTFRLTSGGTNSGEFSAASGAVLELASGFTIADGSIFSGAGLIRFANNTSTSLSGTIANSGNILINSTGSFTDWVLTGDVTLSGNGSITLSNAARIRGSGILINAGNTIGGEANNTGSGLGADQIGIVNQSGGVIDANVSGGVLNVDPNSANGLTNEGTMQASGGGILLLNGNGGGAFNNSAGTILALDGSQVQLTNGASISGGILNTVGTGLFRTLNSAVLTNLANAGAFLVTNGTSLTLVDTINNSGSFTLNSTGSFTDLLINSDVTLVGGGVINIANAGRVRGTGTLFNGGINGEAHTIQGEGNNTGSGLGNNELTIVNRSGGLIDANISGAVLNVDPGAGDLTNQGLMRASNGGFLRLNGNGGGTFINQNIISALNGSEVQLINGATITGGTLSTAGTGVIRNIGTATLDSLTNTGSFIANNGTSTTFTGTITSTGSILLNSTGSFTDLFINGNVTLTGGSALTLSNAARIRGGGTLFIGGSAGQAFTVQGEANNSGSGLGNNELTVVNRSGGLINANVAGAALNVDPGSGGLTNQGLMQASNGGILLLNGNGVGAFDNSGGTILALDGSQVQLTNGASISGGLLNTAGSGLFRTLNSATLTDLTNAGAFHVTNGTSLTLVGTINDTGSISLDSSGSFTDLFINSDVTLLGGGALNIANAGRVRGSGTLFNGGPNGEAHIIQGEGNNTGSGLGANELTIVNRSGGLVDANINGAVLNVDPGAGHLTNQGLMRASNGGILQLNGNGGGDFLNQNIISALDGSEVRLVNGVIISGGTLSTAGNGVIRNIGSATLDSLTNTGTFIANNGTSTTFTGTITSTGSILLNSTGSFTDLFINGNVTLIGGSALTLSNAARIRGSGTLFIGGASGEAFTIQGEANNTGSGLGNNELTVVNRTGGLIHANVSGGTLNVDPGSGGLTNQGLMQASNGGILQLNGNGGGVFNSSGTIAAITGGVLRFNGTVNSSGIVDVGNNTLTATGTYTQTGAGSVFRLAGGSVQSNNALVFNSGLIDARGTINAAIQNNAMLRPALGGSGLAVTGNISLLSSSQLIFQIGGLTQGSQYGFIGVNGTVSLGGQLVLSFVNGFMASASDSFTLMSTNGLSGAFTNIASGERLTTSDGSGSFLVNYNGSSLVLSNFMSSAMNTTATYLGGANGWSTPAAWSTNPLVPSNGNGGNNYNVVLTAGSLNQNIAPGVIIQQLQMSGGTLTLNNPLTLNTGLQFSGGTITNGVLNVAGTSTQSAVLGATGLTLNNSGSYSFTQASGNLFSGTGAVFNNSGTLARSTGTSGVTFNASLNNSGILRASNGATLILTGSGGVLYNNTGGTIEALDGSTIQLTGQASITGGTLSTAGSGVIQANSSSNTSIFLTDLTLAGALVGISDSDITLGGTITNTGSITSAATSSVTDIVVATGGLTLNGGGTINLSSSNDGIRAATSGDRLTNVDNLIRGRGLLGQNSTAITNQSGGIIDANVSGASLTLDPANVTNAFVNDGLLRASNGGILILSGNGGGAFTNNNLITALNGSIVQLTGQVSITGGTLSTTGSGVIQANSSSNTSIFLTDLTLAGALVGISDSDITLGGTITNTGSITSAATSSVTDIVVATGGLTLNGGGTINLSSSNDGIRAATSGDRLTNVDNLIRGRGLLGQNSASVTNQSGGIIDANVSGASLTLDPANVTDAFVNNGLLRASNGGILILSGNGGGAFTNNNLITALNGSIVQLTGQVSITGGTLSTTGSGVIQANSSSNTSIFLTDLTLAGALVGISDSDITLGGTITNTGSITSAATSSVTDIVVATGGLTLNGGGTINLSSSNDGIRAATSGDRLTNVDNLIRGRGLLGQNSASVTNQSGGIIDANVSGASLTLDPANVTDAFVNNGLLRASNGGILILSGNGGGVFTNNNLITALDGSVIQLTAQANIVGGTLSTAGSGVIQANSSANTSIFLTDLTIAGALVAINDSDVTLAGTITNTGSITSAATSSVTDLVIAAGGVTLTGGGTVTLSTSNDGIRAVTGARLTNVNNLIQGQGLMGQNNTAFTNQAAGVIDANVNGATLTLDPVTEASVADGGASFLNAGLLRASNGGILVLSGASGGAFTNSGTIAATTGGVLRFNGTVNSSGTVDVGNNTLTATGTYTQSGRHLPSRRRQRAIE